jgi:hypothetical protein
MKIPFPKYEAEVVAEIEAYLDMHYQTEIINTREVYDELVITFARGHRADNSRSGTRNHNNYARPMFETMELGVHSAMTVSVSPCIACDRFDRSWNCAQHGEVPWDSKRKAWLTPGREVPEPPSLSEWVVALSEELPPPRGLFYDPEPPPSHQTPTVTGQRLWVVPDLSITVEGTFEPRWLEIASDTIQTAPPVRLEVEPDDR